MNKEYHVSKVGSDNNYGTKTAPFLTISKAAEVATAGDTVIVHEGVYREWVRPQNSGRGEMERIIFKAARNESVSIKGSEVIKGWKKYKDTVWKAVISNQIFGDYNPYQEEIWGDWLLYPKEYKVHTGDVYLNGKSLYEASSMEELYSKEMRLEGYSCPWSKRKELIREPGWTIYRWYCETDADYTTIYANFNGYNPNNELVEINVRKSCFMPELTGINYITVCGFEIAQGACGWAPPTAEQMGLIGPNMSIGWIIENNKIHDAKCSGISLGRTKTIRNNEATTSLRKPGYQYQLEIVCKALELGWGKDTVGSHIIRNNTIYCCGQNGIVGHLGSIFSRIEHNHIFEIGTKYEFYGHEIAGIKLHAAIDTYIVHNRIDHCTLGTWLDWEAQGVHVSKNIYYENNRDIFIEVSHGPCMIDNNIFGSEYSIDNASQGSAFINNLICGGTRKIKVLDRATPYHYPHSTGLMGFAYTYGGDDRLINNIFIGGEFEEPVKPGTMMYNEHPSSYEQYITLLKQFGSGNDHGKFIIVEQPVMIQNNAYFNNAPHYKGEQHCYDSSNSMDVKFIEQDEKLLIEFRIDDKFLKFMNPIVTTKDLGTTRISEGSYDNLDGSPLCISMDMLDYECGEKRYCGPLQQICCGTNQIRLW